MRRQIEVSREIFNEIKKKLTRKEKIEIEFYNRNNKLIEEWKMLENVNKLIKWK
jgi:hypothetical protein